MGKFILIDRITKKISIYEDYIMHSLYEINYTSYYIDAEYMHTNTYDFFPHSRPMSVRQSHVCSSMVSQCPLIWYIQCWNIHSYGLAHHQTAQSRAYNYYWPGGEIYFVLRARKFPPPERISPPHWAWFLPPLLWAHFPSIWSVDPPSPPRGENVKILKKISGPPGVP